MEVTSVYTAYPAGMFGASATSGSLIRDNIVDLVETGRTSRSQAVTGYNEDLLRGSL